LLYNCYGKKEITSYSKNIVKMVRSVSKAKTKYNRKSEQLNISVSPYIKEQLEELVERGLFSNISDAVRWAIAKMIAEFEAEGKIPKKSAEVVG
jgi:hypothetical protein